MVKLMLRKDERAIVDIIASERKFKKIPEKLPLDFIVNNRVCYLLYKKVEKSLDIKRLNQLQNRAEKTRLLLDEIHNLSRIFRENNINFIMSSKSIESQCDGHDVDVFVKNQMEKVKNIMKDLGYISVPWGGAYAKKIGEITLIIDIYREQGGIIFDGDRKKREINGIYIFSPEHELCSRLLKPIRIHHTNITLGDIIHLSNLLDKYNIQSLPKNLKKSLIIPCFHSIYLINTLYKALYSRDIKAPIVERAKKLHKRSRIWKFLSKIEIRKVNLPFRSLIFSYTCFLYKLFYDTSHFNFKETVRNILYFINNATIPVSNTHVSILALREILKRKRIVVCFAGMDGTGKTSHAKKIVKTFKNMGIPCQYVWCSWVPRVSYPLMALVYLIKRYRRKDYYNSKILRKIWNYIVIFDFLYLYVIRVKIPLLIGKNVVCDRYVYDMIADLMYDGLYNERASKILLKLVPKPDLVFMLDVPEEISDLRKDDTKDAVNIKESDSALDYLRIHRKNYLKIAESLNIPVLDATKDFEELKEEIYKQVLRAYTSKNNT